MLICVFCFFQMGIFVDVKTFHDPEWKLLSVSISGMSILVEIWGYNSESWSDTLIKQFNTGIESWSDTLIKQFNTGINIPT